MDAITSPYLIAIVAAWVIAQGLKYVFAVLKTRNLANLRQLYLSGNMPSAHSAGVVALATVIGLRNGFDSAVFGIAFLFAAVVMYDAVMVRRSSGEQGIAIQELIKISKVKIVLPRAAKGHTPAEVLVGIVLGIIIGSVVFFATK
jgi:acid phosphatase family membrane protein YuiD